MSHKLGRGASVFCILVSDGFIHWFCGLCEKLTRAPNQINYKGRAPYNKFPYLNGTGVKG